MDQAAASHRWRGYAYEIRGLLLAEVKKAHPELFANESRASNFKRMNFSELPLTVQRALITIFER